MPYKDPELRRACVREAVRRYKKTDHGKAKMRAVRRSAQLTRSFVGVDGEGGGVNENGQQNYLLLRAGGAVLFDGNRRLGTRLCLDFLLQLDPGCLAVSYFFDYDCTQILRDIPAEKLKLILDRSNRATVNGGRSPGEYWEDYVIEWHPRKHLSVGRLDRRTNKLIPGSRRVIHDVGTFFQCSFVKALTDWDIGTQAERDRILREKQRRSSFEMMTETEIEYNHRECIMLAELMDKFREVCVEVGYTPRLWEGPGYLASAMMEKHGVMKAKELDVSEELYTAANDAYYGGRFEIFKVGEVENVTEYDICSAYPAAYLHLPCLKSGCHHWSCGGDASATGLYLAKVHFRHRTENPIVCHLPVRLASGTITWPREGVGWYWSTELNAALAAGTVVTKWLEVRTYEKSPSCDHYPFRGWVNDVYAERQRIGKTVRGYPLKLALNSVYGKCCQSIGNPAYANAIWGGLITADVRRRLIEAYSPLDPRSLVMLATDGMYVCSMQNVAGMPEGALEIGSELGQWERGKPDTIFIVKPGMYAWNNGIKVKTRGVPKAEFENAFPVMQRAWQDYFTGVCSSAWPSHAFSQTVFIGSRLALHLGKPERAGAWVTRLAVHSFDPTRKRRPGELIDTTSGLGHMTTYAHLGSPSNETVYYSKFKTIGGTYRRTEPVIRSEMEIAVDHANMLTETLPDHQGFDDLDSGMVSVEDIV